MSKVGVLSGNLGSRLENGKAAAMTGVITSNSESFFGVVSGEFSSWHSCDGCGSSFQSKNHVAPLSNDAPTFLGSPST